MLVLGALDRFTQTGIEEAIIQRKNASEEYFNVAWTINIIRSLVIFALLYFLAPYAAYFFRDERVDPVIKTISLILILNALYNIGIVHLKKSLSFNKLFIYRFSGNLADFLVAISVALVLKNVWALIFGLLAGHYVRLVISYFIHPYRPRINLNRNAALEILKFGGWLTGISMIAFLFNQGDDAVIGRVLGTTSLGFYYLAYFISSLPATEISLLVPRVTLPAYVKIGGDTQRLKESYLRVLQMTAFFSFPCGIGLVLLAKEFTMVFLGVKWKPIILPLQVLALSGILTSIISTGGSLFYACGKPKIEFQIQCIRFVVLACIIYPLTITWGMVGTALAVVSGSVAVLPVWLSRSIQILEANHVDLLQKLLPSCIASSIMLLGILFLKQILYDISILNFICLVLLGISLYFLTHFFIWKRFRIGPLEEVKAILALKSAEL